MICGYAGTKRLRTPALTLPGPQSPFSVILLRFCVYYFLALSPRPPPIQKYMKCTLRKKLLFTFKISYC